MIVALCIVLVALAIALGVIVWLIDVVSLVDRTNEKLMNENAELRDKLRRF